MENNKSIELITALMQGEKLERNHAEKGDYWYETRAHISILSSYVYNEKRYFEIGGWGSAFGNAKDRVIELLTHPDEWSIVLNTEQNAQASDTTEAK